MLQKANWWRAASVVRRGARALHAVPRQQAPHTLTLLCWHTTTAARALPWRLSAAESACGAVRVASRAAPRRAFAAAAADANDNKKHNEKSKEDEDTETINEGNLIRL